MPTVIVPTSTKWKVYDGGTPPAGFHDAGYDASALDYAVDTGGSGSLDGLNVAEGRWIWSDAGIRPSGEERSFRREFDLEDTRWARLLVAADNGCEVYINGTLVATHNGDSRGADDLDDTAYTVAVEYDVASSLLVAGTNCISIIAWNETSADPGPADVFAVLTVGLRGTSSSAAHCDHGHLAEELASDETDTALVLSPDGNGGVGWQTLTAEDIPFTPTGSIAATNVQDAIAEAASESGGGGLGAWTSYTPAWTASTSNPSLGNGILTGRYKLLDADTMIWQVHLAIGSTTTAGSGTWRFGLPSGITIATTMGRQVGVGNILDSGATNYVCAVEFSTSATDRTHEIHVADDANPRNVDNNSPITWANGDQLVMSATLEVVQA